MRHALRPRRDRSPARIDVDSGRSVLAAVFPGALLVVTTTLVGTTLHLLGTSSPVTWAVALAGAIAVTRRADPPVPHVLVGCVGLLLLWSDGPFQPAVLALVPLAHLVLRLAWWTDHVPAPGRVEIAALVPDARRFLVIQAGLLGLGALAWWASGTVQSDSAVVLGAGAFLALTVLVVLPRR